MSGDPVLNAFKTCPNCSETDLLPAVGPDPCLTGGWQTVTCGDCHRVYHCTPFDDHYLREGDPEGSPRVCERCLIVGAS